MSDLNLQTFNKLYPMVIHKYNDLFVDQNATVTDKINSIIDYLNSVGKLTNDVVKDWNTVYQWVMNDGLTTDVNNKIEAMNANGELNSILTTLFNTEIGDLTALQTTAKNNVVAAINENQTNIASNAASLAQIAFNVKNYGAKGDGVTDDSTAIQNAINASSIGSSIFFPAGTYMISNIITILPNRTYMGTSWGSTIKQMDGKNLAQMVQFGDQSSQHANVIIKDLQFDGNRDNNSNTVGLFLFGLLNSMLYRVRVQNCAGTGYFLEGNVSIQSSTNHLIDCWAFQNTGYGVYFSGACADNHIIGGDFGANWNSAFYCAGVSSSAKNAVFWGTQSGSGVIIAGVSNQLTGNNIEGHAGHGVEVQASHNYIQGNKIYDNANVSSAYGQKDGVYVNGTSSVNVENVIIEGNDIYAGLYASTGYYRYAVNLDTYHINCEVNGNSVRYAKSNGTKNNTNAVNGLKDQDVYDGTLITTTANRPTSAALSQKVYDITLNKPIYWNGSGWKDSTGSTV